MKIYFVNDGKNSVVDLSYDFKEIADAVMVSFPDKSTGDMLFSKTDGIWRSATALQVLDPVAYANIQEAILKHFRLHEVLKHIRFKPSLS